MVENTYHDQCEEFRNPAALCAKPVYTARPLGAGIKADLCSEQDFQSVSPSHRLLRGGVLFCSLYLFIKTKLI